MTWSATLTKADNGYILKTKPEANTFLIEEADGVDCDKAEAEAFVRAAHILQEHFGVYNSKHNDWQLVIEVQNK